MDSTLRSEHRYDGEGARRKTVAHLGPATQTTHVIAADYEWNEEIDLGSIHLTLAGTTVATVIDGGGASSAVPGLWDHLPDWPSPREIAAGILTALALALLAHLLWLRRIGLPVPRAALSGATAWLFLAALSAPVAAAPRDGDVNEDGVLDAADLLRLHLVAIGMETATQADQDRGDVAPMGGAPDGINPADPLLLSRALRGENVDGDGLTTAEELAAEASPFRSDTDSDFRAIPPLTRLGG